ncbi:MAG: SusC/RagA family TonB-linked outer membrane protein [Bacteroidales bacterium]
MRKICLIFFVILGLLGNSLYAQDRRVTGTVTDMVDGSTLPGVTITVKGTTMGTSTDGNGRYELTVPQGAVLVFSFIGMLTEEIVVGDRNIINIAMIADISMLDEIIVVAYGTARRGTFTGAATQVTSEQIENRPLTNAARAIEGLSAGVQVSAGSGQPGSGQDIRIRGFGSVNASSSPLIVVDGVPSALSLNDINTADIESVSVLKDASATALYGSRAANGVIMVTTKRGSSARSQFQVNASRGFSNRALPEYDRLGPERWTELAWETYRNRLIYSNNVDPEVANQRATDELVSQVIRYNPFNVPNDQIVGPDGQLNPNARLIYSKADLDWQDALTRMGDRSEVSMTYSGGQGATNHFVSIAYLDDQGFLINSNFERLTARLNLNSQPASWLNTGLNLSGSFVSSESARDDSNTGFVNPFFFSRSIGPIFPIYVIDPETGDYILDEAGQKIWDLGGMAQYGLPARPQGAHNGRHVLAETLLNQDGFKRNTLSARTFGEVKFLDGFSFTFNAGLDFGNYLGSRFDNPLVGDGAPAGRGERINTVTRAITLNQLLKYERSIGFHSFDALLGHETYDWNYNYARGFSQGIIFEGSSELINFTTINASTSFSRQYRTEGFLSRFNYSYDDRYIFSGSFRRDGSSKFYKDNRWGNFWSLGGAWRLDREAFFQEIAAVNMLMLRVSYGQVGNDNLLTSAGATNYYPWHPLYSYNNNANNAGLLHRNFSATELVWESNNSFTAGLEFGLFGRLRGNVDFFHRISDNLLFSVPLPISSGVLSEDKNIGTMYNQGLELRLAYDVLSETNLRWTVDFNATTFSNKITKMPGGADDEIITGTKKLMEGRSLYDFWLRQWWGVDPEDGRSLYYAENTSAANVRIINGDTLTFDHNNARFDYSGTSIPTLVGALTNTFSFGPFDVNVMLTYQLGGKIYDGVYASLMGYSDFGQSMHADLANRWQKPGDITDVPRLNTTEVTAANAQSDRWLTNASYLNVRSVSVFYTLPTDMARSIYTQRVRLYVSGENLHLFSHRKGMNVQQSFAGVTSNLYTPARSITFGVNVSF